MKEISHVFFDFDWVIANTEDIYIQTRCDILTEEWKKFCKTNYLNSTDVENYEQFKKWIVLEDNSLSNVRLIRKERFDKYVINWQIDLIKDVMNVINFFYEHYTLSVVSNSNPELVKLILSSHNITNMFANIYWLSWDRIAKPSPDIYLKALKELEIESNEALTIEDSVSWVRSAIQANIPCYCVSPLKNMQLFSQKNDILYFPNMKSLLSYVKKHFNLNKKNHPQRIT